MSNEKETPKSTGNWVARALLGALLGAIIANPLLFAVTYGRGYIQGAGKVYISGAHSSQSVKEFGAAGGENAVRNLLVAFGFMGFVPPMIVIALVGSLLLGLIVAIVSWIGSLGKIRGRLKWIAVIGVFLGCLFIARLILGVGVAAIHYASTPSFSEYVESHPVSDSELAKFLPTGEAISEIRQWSTGDVDTLQLVKDEGDFQLGKAIFKIEIEHGNDNLLSFEEKFAVSLERDFWTHHGVRARVSALQTAENMRAVVVTTLSDPEKMVGKDSKAAGGAIIDVFLVAGTDPSETYFQLSPDGKVLSGGTRMNAAQPDSWWQMATGMKHNLEPLPEEGLIHHVRLTIYFNWKKDYVNHRHSGPMTGFSHEVNTSEYSYKVIVSTKHSIDGEGEGDTTHSFGRQRTWGSEIW